MEAAFSKSIIQSELLNFKAEIIKSVFVPAEVRQSKDLCRNEKQKYVRISTFLNMVCYAYIGKMSRSFYLTDTKITRQSVLC